MKYYNKHIASSYRCHWLGVFLSNVPKDRKVFPKQRACLKDHPPCLEHFAPPNFATVSSIIVLVDLAMAYAGGLWQSDHSGTPVSKTWMDFLLWWSLPPAVCLGKHKDFVYWIHQINLYWSSTCPIISSSPCQVGSILITLQYATEVVT